MKQLIALLLALIILSVNLAFLISCSGTNDDGDEGGGLLGGDIPGEEDLLDPDDGNEETENDVKYDSAGIIVPEYKDYGKSTKKFSVYALDYARPDVDALCADFYSTSALIRENNLSFDEQLARLESLDAGYASFYSMLNTAEIFNSKDTANEFWSAEYNALSVAAPAFAKAVEDVFVAAAGSEHRESFEREYFHTDISEYADGGIYTDAVVAIMAEETALENEYKSISPSNVIITFKNSDISITDTYECVLRALEELYGSTASTAYLRASTLCEGYYRNAVADKSIEVYLDLVLKRAELAKALGYDSYIDLAYDSMGYNYSPELMLDFIDEITTDVYPVYKRLSTLLFSPYFSVNSEAKQSVSTIINTAYYTSMDISAEFGDIYAYMLQNELYDMAPLSSTRFDASFTTYIGTNESPYCFITSTGYLSDYSTLTHEFGHFIDYYVNNDSLNSLELAEVCSQGFEYLSLIKVESRATEKVYKYMKYDALASAFEILIQQGLYASFEHSVYNTDAGEMSFAKLEALAKDAAEKMFGTSDQFELDHVMIPHLFIAPMYVQSYCTSIVPALEIYLLETDKAGDGISAYRAIIYRDEADADFVAALQSAGLTSPFKPGFLGDISCDIYYLLTGIQYKSTSSGSNAA